MNNCITEKTPAYQMDGLRLLDALADIGVIKREFETPEPNQTQFSMKLDSEYGSISQEQLKYFQEKFRPDSLEVINYYDDCEDEHITIVEFTYGKDPVEELI